MAYRRFENPYPDEVEVQQQVSWSDPSGLNFYIRNIGKRLIRTSYGGKTVYLEPQEHTSFMWTGLNSFPEITPLNNGV